jgi:hypothetical protein
VLDRLLYPLPWKLLRQAAADHEWDEWSRKMTFPP